MRTKSDDFKFIVILTILHFIISLKSDMLYFEYSLGDKEALIIKSGFIIVLFTIYSFVFYIIKKYRNREELVKKATYSMSYFFINIVFLVLVWPGMWVDMSVLELAVNLELQTWHHVLSSLIDIYSAMLLPFTAGIIIVQVVIISLIVGHLVVELDKVFYSSARVKRICIFCAFWCPALFLYNLNNFRAVLYTYVSIFFAVEFFKLLNNRSATTISVIIIIISGILTCMWRSEGIVWLVILSIVLFIDLVKNKMNKTMFIIFMGIFCGSVMVWGLNSFVAKNDSRNYGLTATIRQVVAVVRDVEIENLEDNILVEQIDKVVSVDIIYKYEEKNGAWLYWNMYDEFIREFSDDEFQQYLLAFVRLSIRHLPALIEERSEMFLQASGIDAANQKNIVDDTIKFTDEDTHQHARELITNHIGGLWATPFNVEFRNKIIYLMGGRDYLGNVTWLSYLWYNAMEGILTLVCVFLVALIKKKSAIVLINGTVILQLLVVFITEPDPNYFYMLPAEMLGRVELFVIIGIFICKNWFSKDKIDEKMFFEANC